MKCRLHRPRLRIADNVDEGPVPIEESELGHDLCMFATMRAPSTSKTEAECTKPSRHHRLEHPTPVLRARVEHEETAAARAHQLSADGACFTAAS